jgi:hypothetical protein
MSWSKDYKKSIDCDSPKGFSQRAHCAARKKRAKGEETKSKSPFNEMHEVKSHKSVEQIAKKHRLDVSFIKKQLEMGIPIEHEHTKDKDLATDIALQHLDEIPDYYTRLKKMEADAKKHHKKFKDVKEETASGDEGLHDWFNKSKSSDDKKGWVQLGGKWAGKPCARQPGQTSTPKCGSSKMKRALSKDEEEAARRRKNRLDPNQPEKTGGAKPTNVRTEEMDLQEVKDKPGKGSGEKDACYHKVKSRYSVWPSAYASGALVKCRKVGADNWGTKSEDCWDGYKQEGMKKKGNKVVPNCVPVKEEQSMIRYCPKCNKDETRSECKYGPKYWDMFSIPSALTTNQLKYNIATVHPGNFPESYDHEHSMARSEISTIISAAKRLRKKMKGEGNIEAWVQSKITKAADYLDSAADYVDSGEMKAESVESEQINEIAPLVVGAGLAAAAAAPYLLKKFAKPAVDKALDNATKTNKLPLSTGGNMQQLRQVKQSAGIREENLKTFTEFMEDWQKVNRQDKTDGLSQKAVDAYRRENPGSKLQTAVTEKNPTGKRAGRRKNFCSRMKGMKSKLTSAKTARDPDSRINKALRRWNCN